MGSPRALKDTIQDLMRALSTKSKASFKDNPLSLLKKVLSKKEMQHVGPHYFKNGVLSINVDSSSWLYRLNLQKEDLLFKLRKESSVVIKEIRFYLGDKR